MIAVVYVSTRFTAIPVGIGYFNIGDTAIIVASILFGWKTGMAAGALGSALSDLTGPWAYYAPVTLVVKGLEGLVTGIIAGRTDVEKRGYVIPFVSIIAGMVVMIAGYFIGDLYVLRFFSKEFGLVLAVRDLPVNAIQGLCSLIAGNILVGILGGKRLKNL